MSLDRHLEDYLLDLIRDTTLAGHGIDTTGLTSAVRERLAAADPSNTLWQRDLSLSYHKVGDWLVAQGKLDEALGAWDRALDRDPTAVAVYARRGAVLETMGRPAEAREAYAAYLERGGPDAALVRRRIEHLMSPEAPK